jgi:hypothetical protein
LNLMVTRDDDVFAPFGRLADERGDRPGETAGVRARAVELLESVDPIRFQAGRKQRLLLSLGRGSVRHGWRWLRPVLAGAVLLSGGAVASAALTGWPARLMRSLETPAPPRLDPSLVARPATVHSNPAARATAFIETNPKTVPPPLAPVRRAPIETRSRRPQAELLTDDPSLLADATHALRVNRDPALARALAKLYLDRQPRGALADEALAISIEAAIDHHDADAEALSARYLAQFPRGSFRALAERTIASSPQH